MKNPGKSSIVSTFLKRLMFYSASPVNENDRSKPRVFGPSSRFRILNNSFPSCASHPGSRVS